MDLLLWYLLGHALQDTLYCSTLPLAPDSVRDVKHLVKAIILGVKSALTTIFTMHKAYAATGATGAAALAIHVLSDDEVDLVKSFVAWSLQCISTLSTSSVGDRAPTGSAGKESKSESPQEASRTPAARNDSSSGDGPMDKGDASSSQQQQQPQQQPSPENDQDIKVLLEHLVQVFLVLSPLALIRSVLGSNLDLLLELSNGRPVFISMIHFLLVSNSSKCSPLTLDTVLTFFIAKLPTLACCDPKSHKYGVGSLRASSEINTVGEVSSYCEKAPSAAGAYPLALLRMQKVALGIISVSSENEKVLRSRLKCLILQCLRLGREAQYTLNYILALRAVFRSVSGGKFEHSYREIASILPDILDGLDMMLRRSSSDNIRCAIYELYLSIPCRLESLLPHFTRILNVFSYAVWETSSDTLANLSLRTLEFWIENLNPEYLLTAMQSQSGLLSKIFSGICAHLKPAPYPYGSLAVRVLGKFGGRNRKFLANIFPPSACCGFEKIRADEELLCADVHNISRSSPSGATIQITLSTEQALHLNADGMISGACTLLKNLLPPTPGVEAEIMSLHLKYSPSSTSLFSGQQQSLDDMSSLQRTLDVIMDSSSYGSDLPKGTPTMPLTATLQKHLTEETGAIVKSVLKSQLTSAFELLQSCVLEMLPALTCANTADGSVLSMLDGEVDLSPLTSVTSAAAVFWREYNGDNTRPVVADIKRRVLRDVFFGIICSCCYVDLKVQAEKLLIGVCYHIATVKVQGYAEIDVVVVALYDALLEAALSFRDDVYGVGMWVLKKWVIALGDVCTAMARTCDETQMATDDYTASLEYSQEMGNVSSLSEHAGCAIRLLLDRMSTKCECSAYWNTRIAALRILNTLCEVLPYACLGQFDIEIIMARSFFAILDFARPEEFVVALEEVIPAFLNILSLCQKERVSARESDLAGDAAAATHAPNETAVALLFEATGSPNTLVRIAGKCGLNTLSSCYGVSVACLVSNLSDNITSLLVGEDSLASNKLDEHQQILVGVASKLSYLVRRSSGEVSAGKGIINTVCSLFDHCVDDGSKPTTNATLADGDDNNAKNGLRLGVTEEMLAVCTEEYVDVILRCVPGSVPYCIELTMHTISIIKAIYDHPSENINQSDQYSFFTDKCFSFLYRTLSFRWLGLIDMAATAMHLIVQNHVKANPVVQNMTDRLSHFSINEKIKPFLSIFEQPGNLSVEKLRCLECMLRLVDNRAFLKVGVKLLENLKFWTDPDKVMQLGVWPPGEDVAVAAAIINIFHVLPWDTPQVSAGGEALLKCTEDVNPSVASIVPTQNQPLPLLYFIKKFVDVLTRLQRVLCLYRSPIKQSPFLPPLANFLAKYPNAWVDFFLDSQSMSKQEVGVPVPGGGNHVLNDPCFSVS